jgi:hypothetical protein
MFVLKAEKPILLVSENLFMYKASAIDENVKLVSSSNNVQYFTGLLIFLCVFYPFGITDRNHSQSATFIVHS